MSILYLLIPLALLLLGVAVWAFFWAVGSGQFDDLDTPAMRILLDDDVRPGTGQNDNHRPDAGDDEEEKSR